MSEPVTQSRSIPVSIHGRTYYLRGGDGDARTLERLAAIVDGKMREVADATGTVDTLKIAILACLNLADDYTRARDGLLPDDGDTDRRLARLVARLDEVLAE